MSTSPTLSEIQPLPNAHEYARAFQITEESYGLGGTRQYIANAMVEIRNNQTLREQFSQVVSIGRGLLAEDVLEGDDPIERLDMPERRRISVAYALGYYQQLDPSQLLYGPGFILNSATNLFHGNYKHQNFTSISNPEVRARHASRYTRRFAEQGLSRAGLARVYLDRWAESVYAGDRRLQRAFTLGHGAMMTCALHFQEVKNDMFIRAWLDRIDLDDKIQQLIEGKHKQNESE